MAYSFIDLAGTAGQSLFTFSSPYISQSHIHAYIAGVETTAFTFTGTFIIQLNAALAVNATVRIRRITPISSALVAFVNGSVLVEGDLNNTALQLLYALQEASDTAGTTLVLTITNLWDALGSRITNVGTPTASTDAPTKAYVDAAFAGSVGGHALSSHNDATTDSPVAGDILVANDSVPSKMSHLAIGANATLLEVDTTQPKKMKWTTLALKLFQLLTTKGDIAVSTGVTSVRQAVGANGALLVADSAQTNGLKWSGDLLDSIVRFVGSADATKKLAVEVDGFTTGVTRTLTAPDQDLTLSSIWAGKNDFRLSLTDSLPVTTADVLLAGAVYAVPFKGNAIALYNGTTWALRTSTQLSLVLTVTAGKPYDVFIYDNSGVPLLEMLVWTNDSTRATALAWQDGVLVKSGQPTRRYVGTLYASGTNKGEDSAAKRYLWNYYNRMPRLMNNAQETTDSWTYTTPIWRQARASVANQLDFVIGFAEQAVTAEVHCLSQNDNGGIVRGVAIGLDNVTPASRINQAALLVGVLEDSACAAYYADAVVAGRHSLIWLEISTATGTTTWQGDSAGAAQMQAGILGTIWA